MKKWLNLGIILIISFIAGGIGELIHYEAFGSEHYNFYVMLVIVLFSFIVMTLIMGIIKYDMLHLPMTAAIIILLGGWILTLYVPVYHTFDEETHFIRSYNMAINNFIYDYDEPEEYPVYIKDALADNPSNTYVHHSYEDYLDMVERNEQFDINSTEVKIMNSQQVVYTPLPYVASGIGVKIAKWLNFSILRSLQIARFANVVIFAIMAFLAIAIVPGRKLFFLFYFVMPINVFFAISLGTDSFINGLLGLAIALIYYVKCKEGPMSVAEYIILVIMLCAIPCAKSTYAPVLLLLGLIEHEKLPGKLKPALHYIVAIVLMLGMFGFTYWYGSRYGIALWPKPNVDSSAQISYILSNPFTVIWTFIHQTWDGLKLYTIDKYGIFGHMGDALWEGFIMIPGLLALSLIDTRDTRGRFYRIKMIQGDGPGAEDSEQDDEAASLTKYNVFWGIITILGCFGLSMLALYITYTEVGSDEVEGFQGRYCIPIALIIYTLIMFTKRLRIKLKSDVIPTVICFGLMIVGYAGLVSVLGQYNM